MVDRGGRQHTLYGAFNPPATITLDSTLPFCDSPLDIPEIPPTMAHYTSVHEVIHADDHMGGDVIVEETREHILRDHRKNLDRGMEIIRAKDDENCIADETELANLWAMQYADLLTHYRSFVVMRHHDFPKLDVVWENMQGGLFPPYIITKIEKEKDTRYVFEEIIRRVGAYCIIDAVDESIKLEERDACKYAV